MPITIIRYSQQERKERRKNIAKFVEENDGDLDKAIKEFDVSRHLAISACREYCVQYNKEVSLSNYELLAILILDNPPDAEAARKVGLSRQRVGIVRQKLRDVGIPFGIRGLLNGTKANSKLKLKKA